MEQAAPPQGPYKPNWFDRHKAITGLSLVFLFLLVIFPFVPKTSNDVATLGAQTGRTSPVLSQPLSSTLLPTETPTPTDIPTKAPTQPTSIYSEPTTTPLPATPQTETHQTTQQQQCT